MRVPLLLSLPVLAGCSVAGGNHPGGGSISGRILYPSEVTPAMRICAFTGASAAPMCISSAAGSTQYRLGHLSAGDYQVVAKLAEADMRVGGHMQQVQCIRAPCPDQLKTVNLAAGADLAGIDLNEFYATREDFPAMP